VAIKKLIQNQPTKKELFEIKAQEYERGLKDAYKNQPEVDKGFIEKWAIEIYHRIIEMPETLQSDLAEGNFKLWIEQILQEAGIKVKK